MNKIDLRITIKDDQDVVMDKITIYQDGSDSDGARKIRRMLELHFDVEQGEDTSPHFMVGDRMVWQDEENGNWYIEGDSTPVFSMNDLFNKIEMEKV